jgi:two-component system OmpR family sensor kinase
MTRHLTLRTMRARLAAAIAVVAITALGGGFFALHQRIGADLQGRIDSNLREQYGEFQQELPSGISSGPQLERAARSFIASQRYHPESRIFLVQVGGGRTVTNEHRVVTQEIRRVRLHRGSGLFHAPDGLANVSTEAASRLRVYSQPIVANGRRLGTFRVADPRAPIERAQSALLHTFLLVGVVALLASLAVAGWLATLITRPIRRVAGVASDVDAGDLTHRIGDVGGSVEVQQLAESFDHMLDRLEGGFERQRQFVSDASHELRTPLTVLRGQTELLEQFGDDPEERRNVVAMLLSELDQMNKLVDDMLSLARAEAGELVRPRPIVLGELIEDLERDLPLLGERDYRVKPMPDGVVNADPERLTQVFRNLIRNAVDHTGPGDGITISGIARNGSIEFCVADTGPGIPPDRLDRIFDRFHRVDEARDRDHGGSGLGLAIARAIVEAHGGRIWAESPPGTGAFVRFTLPDFRQSPAPTTMHVA